MNDGQWTEQEHSAHLHKASQATHDYVWNRSSCRGRKAQSRICSKYGGLERPRQCDESPRTSSCTSWSTSKGCFFYASSSRSPCALRQHDPSKAPQLVLPKKAPLTTGRGRPAGFYSDTEPPRIGSEQVQPAPPPKLPGFTPTAPAYPPRPPPFLNSVQIQHIQRHSSILYLNQLSRVRPTSKCAPQGISNRSASQSSDLYGSTVRS